MTAKVELAGHPHALRPRTHALELNAGLEIDQLGAFETGEKIEMPPGATELAVGRRLEPDFPLPPDDLLDLAIFDRPEGSGRDGAALALRPRCFQRRRAQQAAHMIGAKR